MAALTAAAPPCANPAIPDDEARHDTGPRSRDLGEESPLTAAQERTLAGDIARGDGRAADRLARANLGLVVCIARTYRGLGLEMDDLVGEGNLGLLRAVADFDPDRGARFATYASYWIRQAIRDALSMTARTVRLPAHMVATLREWGRVERQMAREGCSDLTFDRVADRLALSGPRREMVRRARRASFAGAEGGEGDRALAEEASRYEPPGEALDRSDEAADLRARMAARLDAREREVLALRYGLESGEPQILRVVGSRLGITREWARRIEVGAVRKLGDGGDGPGAG